MNRGTRTRHRHNNPENDDSDEDELNHTTTLEDAAEVTNRSFSDQTLAYSGVRSSARKMKSSQVTNTQAETLNTSFEEQNTSFNDSVNRSSASIPDYVRSTQPNYSPRSKLSGKEPERRGKARNQPGGEPVGARTSEHHLQYDQHIPLKGSNLLDNSQIDESFAEISDDYEETEASEPPYEATEKVAYMRSTTTSTVTRRRSIHDWEVDSMRDSEMHDFWAQPGVKQQQVFSNTSQYRPSNIDQTLVNCFLYLIIFVLVSSGGWYWLVYSGQAQNKLDNHTANYDKFISEFSKLKKQFPTQEDDLWKILRVGTRRIFLPETPEAPAVFMMVSEGQGSDAIATVNCLAKKYAQVIESAFGDTREAVSIDGGAMMGNAQDIKLAIDETLKAGFRSGSQVAIIKQLEGLAGEAAMMFHGYCDNENTDHRRVAFLFLTYPQDKDNAFLKRDAYVEEFLRRKWLQDLDIDKIDPLLSRIGNSNVYVFAESRDTLNKLSC